MTYTAKVHMNGPDEQVVESGGSMDIKSGGSLKLAGTALTPSAEQINALSNAFAITALDGTAGKKACVTNGISLIAGGTGIADMSLAAPAVGNIATIRIGSITGGSVVVTTAAGVTIDGTEMNTITFDAANEAIVLVYGGANRWNTWLNIGGVALSKV